MKCWYTLDIDLKGCFKDDFKFPVPQGEFGVWTKPADQVSSPAWRQYMKSLGLPVTSFMMFYRGSHASTKQAHIDILKLEPWTLTNFAINWCFGGTGSEMIWYNTPTTVTKISYTSAKTPYMSWDKDKLIEIERYHLGNKVTVVQTGIPHAIEMRAEPRWCFSARTPITENKPWEEVIDLLRKKKLLIERSN